MAHEALSKAVDSFTKQGAEQAAAMQALALARSRGETDEAPEPLPDPVRTVQMAEAVKNELQVIEREDNTPAVLFVPEHPKVPWAELLMPLVTALSIAIAEPGGITYPASGDETPLQAAIRACQVVYGRVGTAIDGNKQHKKRAAAHREAVFQGRSVNATRPSWERELVLVIAGLKGLKDSTPAERAMIPLVEAALARVRTAPATSAGRPRTEPIYSPRVQATTLALSCALGDFLSWCAGNASEKRLASVQRIITPKAPDRPKSEQKSEQKSEAPANTTQPAVAQGTPGPVAGGQAPVVSGPAVTIPEQAPMVLNGEARAQA